ncbi:MAG: arginine--tRNA ligase [Candidatus Woesearchaeota archaeon]|jgi:arginyl-tRNA synthetase
MDIKKELSKLLSAHTKLEEEQINNLLEIPPNTEMGDYAFPCFSLSKILRKPPVVIAIELKDIISNEIKEGTIPFLKEVNVINAYLNFKINSETYAQNILLKKPTFTKKNLNVMVEFSQPNTHKEFHVGHLRNACLGDSISRLMNFTGYTIIRANYIGDIGTHVAKALWCLEKFHKNDEVPDNKGKYLGKIYVEASMKIEENELYAKEVSEVLQKLESRESEVVALWEKTKLWSIDEFKNIYRDLDIHFDTWFYESEEDIEGNRIAHELLNDKIAELSDGAIIVNLEKKNQGVALVLKSDGTTLYLTKDLSLARKKFHNYDIDKSIYVIDSRQSLHMSQVFSILELMGFNKDMIHVSYEFVSTKQGPIASRKGNVYLYEDLKKRMVSKIIEETKKRHTDWDEEKLLSNSKIMADSALKFGMLKIDNNKEIVFDEEEWLDLEGETGPYILYACARINSIISKAKEQNEHVSQRINFSLLETKEDIELLRLLEKEEQLIDESANNCKPSIIGRYALEIAQKVNEYYHKNQIIQSDHDLMKARLFLVSRAQETIKRTLGLLGIKTLEEM